MKARQVLVPLAAVIVFLVLWEALVWVMGWPNYKMASPSDLIPAYEKYWSLFLIMGWQTLWRTIIGLLLAVIFGTGLGMVMVFRAPCVTPFIRCWWASTLCPRRLWCQSWP